MIDIFNDLHIRFAHGLLDCNNQGHLFTKANAQIEIRINLQTILSFIKTYLSTTRVFSSNCNIQLLQLL